MTHRDVFPRFSVRSVRCNDAEHRKLLATRPESRGKPPLRLTVGTFGERRKALPIRCIACVPSPTRRSLQSISMGHYQRSLVLSMTTMSPGLSVGASTCST